MTQRVAVLGLGTMGMGMAKNLLKAGFPVTAYNRTIAKGAPLAAAGAQIADTPADAARDADVIISMLADDDASRRTWTGEQGALNGAKPGAVIVESSTVTPAWIAELEGLASKRNLSLLDAPVTGSRLQAEAGQLIFLVGGDAGVLERVRPVLAAMSKEIVQAWPGWQRSAHETHQQLPLPVSRWHPLLKGWRGLNVAASIANRRLRSSATGRREVL